MSVLPTSNGQGTVIVVMHFGFDLIPGEMEVVNQTLTNVRPSNIGSCRTFLSLFVVCCD